MSRETLTHLNTQTLIGNTRQRGTAWHYRAEEQGEEQGDEQGADSDGEGSSSYGSDQSSYYQRSAPGGKVGATRR